MPPKRKSSKESSVPRPTKKKRTDQGSENRVRWIRPRSAPGDDDLEIPREFAHSLFGHDWGQVENALDPIRMELAPVCSPLGRLTKQASEENTMTHRINKSSPNLKSFWKKVNDKWRGGKGGRTPIWRTLDSLGPGVAGAGFWTGNEIEFQALENDSRITVTIRERRYQFDLLRVQPGSGGDPRYFIELPHNGSITVNGQTVINGYNDPDRLLIGPLDTFAVIEVRGHTIFWWMTAGLQYDTPGRVVSDQESLRRERIHYNDDVEGYIRLDDIAVPRPPLPHWPVPALPASDDEEEEEGEEVEVEATEEGTEEDEDLALNNNEGAGVGLGEDDAQPTDGQDVFAEMGPCTYVEQHLPALRMEADKIRQEAGDEIKDFPQNLQQAIIEAVLQAINGRQANTALFSLIGRELNDVECLRDGYFFPRGTHPGRPLIASVRLEGHAVLLVLQHQADQTVSMHVFDHRNWVLGPEQRNRIFLAGIGLLRRTRWWGFIHGDDEEDFASKPVKAIWVQSSQYLGKNESVSVCLTILSAWALAMGLELNQNFTIADEEQFESEVRDLFYVALQGKTLDWKLIFAFFRCRELVSDKVPRPPASREFTLDDARIREDITIRLPCEVNQRWSVDDDSQSRDKVSGGQSAADQASKDFTIGNDGFLSDTWSTKDKKVRVPKLSEVGAFRPQMSRDELRQEYNKHIIPAPALELPKDFIACQYLRKGLRTLLQNDAASTWLNELRSGRNNNILKVETQEGGYVQRDELHLCIASVTLAITERQGIKGGFSMMGLNDPQSCQSEDLPDFIPPATRFGRPMLLPWVHKDHTVLLVLQMNANQQPEISVVDSRLWQYSKTQRKEIYTDAVNCLKRSAWWRNIFPDEKSLILPKRAIWRRSAHQSEHWTCGYYAIANAWALSMGLELWPFTMLRANTNFVADVRDIAHLAIGGFVDWRLIYAFLRCYCFVKDDQVVASPRRFGRTVALRNKSDLNMEIDEIALDENLHWQKHGQPDWRGLRQESVVTFHNGYWHDADFASDSWKKRTRDNIVPDLISSRLYGGDPTTTDTTLETCWKTKLPRKIVDGFWNTEFGKRMESEPAASTLQNIGRSFFRHLEEPYGSKKESKQRLIETSPCHFYDGYFRYVSALEKDLEKYELDVVSLPAIKELLQDVHVTSAIASVIEAIDALDETDDKHAGGLALAVSTHVAMARTRIPIELTGCHISRARRCWFLPFVVSGILMKEIYALRKGKGEDPESEAESECDPSADGAEDDGHIFLAVLQEEKQEFRTYILDSAPGYYEDVREFLYHRIKKTAERLQWSTQRNDGQTVAFSESYWVVDVPRQSNQWACGYHTILNAWILALGLTPSTGKPSLNFDDIRSLYMLVQKALAGLLSWDMLVAFLFCRELVQERSLEDIPENRRFLSTVRQYTENDLEGFVEKKYDDSDSLLVSVTEDETPYDLSLNVDFTRMSKTECKCEGDYALNRSYESEDEGLVEGGCTLLGRKLAFRNRFRTLPSNDGETSDPLEFLDRQGPEDRSPSDDEMVCPGWFQPEDPLGFLEAPI